MENESVLPLDERFRNAEQYAFDFETKPSEQTPAKVQEDKSCSNAGFCYCPKCNPR